MFDYTFAHWATFLTAAVLLNLSPGPDIAFILAQTAKNGHRSGFAAMFGIWTGAFLHVLLAAVGLSAILAASATAFTVVKWVGAVYLVWLGVQALRLKNSSFASQADTPLRETRRFFARVSWWQRSIRKLRCFSLHSFPNSSSRGQGPPVLSFFCTGPSSLWSPPWATDTL